MRQQNADPEVRARNAARQRARRQDPEKAAADRETSRRWKRENPERSAAHSRTPEKLLYNLEWNRRNPEKRLAAAKKYQAAHPDVGRISQQRRRARKLGAEASFTQADWSQVLDEFHHRCAYCLRNDLPLQQEHMTPLSKGGAHAVGNVIPSCGPCNYKKHTRDLLQFLGAQ